MPGCRRQCVVTVTDAVSVTESVTVAGNATADRIHRRPALTSTYRLWAAGTGGRHRRSLAADDADPGPSAHAVRRPVCLTPPSSTTPRSSRSRNRR